MGLSIHYSGRFKDAEALPDFISTVKEFAEVYGWKYQIFNTAFPNNQFSLETLFDELYGISFTPKNSESISFVFLSNGRMVCPVRLMLSEGTAQRKDEDSWIYTNSVKTQFAGVSIHQLLIHFFRYLDEKYFNDFKMLDESYYWETYDEEKMKEQFKNYDTLIDNFVLAFETFPMQTDEEITDYFERLIKYINDLRE